MSAHAAKRVGGWRAALAILPWLWPVGGKHSAAERPGPGGHRGADHEYADELKELNRKLKAAKKAKPVAARLAEPRTEFVSTEATEATELALRDRQMAQRDPEGPITGEFTQCHGCGHLGCAGDCPQLTSARRRADFATQWFTGTRCGQLEQQPTTVHDR